jgi:uncharacterized membrane protein YGL010W
MKNIRIKIGIILIVISVVMFLILFSMPFLTIGTKLKITLSTLLIVFGEIFFWVGTILIGKEVWNKYKSYIKSGEWLKRNK